MLRPRHHGINQSVNNLVNSRKFRKARISKRVLRPNFTYAVETKSESAKTKHISKTTEEKLLRKVVKKSREHYVKNKDISTVCRFN